jgi:hypothetical protein
MMSGVHSFPILRSCDGFTHRWKSILPRTLRWWILRRFQLSFVFRLWIYKIQIFSLMCFASP